MGMQIYVLRFVLTSTFHLNNNNSYLNYVVVESIVITELSQQGYLAFHLAVCDVQCIQGCDMSSELHQHDIPISLLHYCTRSDRLVERGVLSFVSYSSNTKIQC